MAAERCWPSLSDPATFGLIVTRGHRYSALVLRHYFSQLRLPRHVGSKRKARTIRDHFLAEKIGGEEGLARLSCPVGVDIAAHTVPKSPPAF